MADFHLLLLMRAFVYALDKGVFFANPVFANLQLDEDISPISHLPSDSRGAWRVTLWRTPQNCVCLESADDVLDDFQFEGRPTVQPTQRQTCLASRTLAESPVVCLKQLQQARTRHFRVVVCFFRHRRNPLG
jgi:hypothetical protein